MPLIEDDLCKSKKYYGELLIRPGMMCAGYEQGQIDACSNDSGGPLTCKTEGNHTIISCIAHLIICTTLFWFKYRSLRMVRTYFHSSIAHLENQ